MRTVTTQLNPRSLGLTIVILTSRVVTARTLNDKPFLRRGKAKVAHALKSQKCGARVADCFRGVEVLDAGFGV